MLWPSRTRRSEQKERGLRVEREELVKRENKQLEGEDKGKNEKELAQMLDENEVDQLETNNLMTAQNVRFLSVKNYYCVLTTFSATVLFRRDETPIKDIQCMDTTCVKTASE